MLCLPALPRHRLCPCQSLHLRLSLRPSLHLRRRSHRSLSHLLLQPPLLRRCPLLQLLSLPLLQAVIGLVLPLLQLEASVDQLERLCCFGVAGFGRCCRCLASEVSLGITTDAFVLRVEEDLVLLLTGADVEDVFVWSPVSFVDAECKGALEM